MLDGSWNFWKPSSNLLNVTTDSLLAFFYYSISVPLVYCGSQRRKLPYAGLLVCVGAFTLVSGTTHLIEVVAHWYPNSWLAQWLKVIIFTIAPIASLLSLLVLASVLLRLRSISSAANQPSTSDALGGEDVKPSATSQTVLADSPFDREQNPSEAREEIAIASPQAPPLNWTHIYQLKTELEYHLNEWKAAWQRDRSHLKSAIDRQKRCSDELYLLQSLTQAIGNASDFHSTLFVVLCQVCSVTNWNYGEVWLPRSDGTVLECSPAWYGNTEGLESFRAASKTLTFPPQIGLPGRVWSSRQPEWIEDISTQSESAASHTQLAQQAGFKAAFGVPILVGEQVLAVLTFFVAQPSNANQHSIELVAAVATQLGVVIQRKQLEEELRKSEERYRAIVDHQPELICRFLSDGTLTFVNDAYCRYFGKTREELLGYSFFQLIPDEYREKTKRHIAVLSRANGVATREYRLVMPNGEIHWQQWTDRTIAGKEGQVSSIEEMPEANYYPMVEFQSIGRDITERRLSEQESARLASMALLSPNPIVETDLVGQVRYLNPEAMRLLPDLQETSAQHPFLVGIPSLARVIQREGSFRREVKIDDVYYEQVLHYLPEIECLRIYAFDITERKQAEEQLIYNAFYDRLTGLPNRALFMDRLRQAVERAKQVHRSQLLDRPYQFAVLFLDLNRFKTINNGLGTQIGDRLLQDYARRLQTCLRPTDTLARLGGDEFGILLEGIQDLSDATHAANSIHQTLSTPFYLEGSEVFMTLSIGIAIGKIGEEKPEDLLRDANIAMHRAKAQGKTCYEVFDSSMHELVVDRLQLETDMRRAIERQEFRVYYQPIVSLSQRKITGFEALLRWQHPQRGLVSPNEFIPAAEETGLITPIGWWALREACRQMSIWQQQFPATPPLTINVNLSCKQFTQPDLLEQIDTILQETQLAVGTLKLEITESLVMENLELVKGLLLELKTREIHLCIDDFGTGYSSLSRLHHFPISTLKIDRSFISRIGAFGENSEIIQAIVNLAQNLSMDVVAEGIELVEQISPLIALQCEYGQGNFFSRPVDGDAASALLTAQWTQKN
ncbi:MAG TPA: EAL domain-containing protein [Allocoleopsis sp.]